MKPGFYFNTLSPQNSVITIVLPDGKILHWDASGGIRYFKNTTVSRATHKQFPPKLMGKIKEYLVSITERLEDYE